MKKYTFADKFSKFKMRFLIVFWIITLLIIGTYFSSFFYSIYSIVTIKDSYYISDYKDGKVTYLKTDEMPKGWIPLAKISKRILGAIITSEDGTFYEHPGYDSEQLNDAINDFLIRKKKLRGASTITQQLMKNLFLNKHKTMGRKAQELFFALLVERYANKDKILELYLNVIEYGEGIYGIGAATKYYFNKTPAQISAREAAFLAMLLPSPKKYAKSFKNRALTRFADRSVSSILWRLKTAGHIGEMEYLEQINSRFAWEVVPVAPAVTAEEPSEEEILDFEEES